MSNVFDLVALVDELKELTWSDGYDRNGSHDAGTYVEYEGRLEHRISEEGFYALAKFIHDKNEAIRAKAMQQAREQALTQAEEIYAEAHSWDYFKEAALAIRALKNKGA